MSKPDPTVTGKLVLKGKIVAKKPMIIGSGNNDLADIEVLKDELGKPFIPATSFVGVLRHCIEGESRSVNLTQSDYFWGSKTDKGFQSALCCRDLLGTNEATIKIRDGVAINSKTGIAKDGSKYDYEVVEPGASFDMYLEVTVREEFDKELFKKILATIVELLRKEEKEATVKKEKEKIKISFGAKTTSGFGYCELEEPKYYEFDFSDFSKKDDVWRWLKQNFPQGTESVDANPFQIRQKTFTIDAAFSIKNSLIVRSYSSDPESSDAVHIKSGEKNVLPGTSIKGAIRARGLKILKTLGWVNAEKKINELFGIADDKDNKKEKIKSRVIVEETEIEKPKVVAELQHRIKIDRFTGGAIKGALFDSMPLWGNGNDRAVKIKMTINDYKEDWEAGLLLLILKDLWNEDLPIGGEKNVGRGILKGWRAKIRWDGQEITQEIVIEEKKDRLDISPSDSATLLNRFCNSLQSAICNPKLKEAANG